PAYFAALLALSGGYAAKHAGGAAGLVAAYVLSSVPLIGIHAVRAGYADLLIAAHLLAACVATWEWLGVRQAGWLILAVLNGLFCILLKREGVAIAGILLVTTLIFALSRAQTARRITLALGAAAIAAVAAGLAWLGDSSYLAAEASGIGF